jgi:hypothetical protein
MLAVVGVLDGCRQVFVKVADHFKVVPEVMREGVDSKAGAFGFRAKRLAEEVNEASAFRAGTRHIVLLAYTDTLLLDRCRTK